MHFDELILRHVEAVPQLAGRLERLLEVVHQLRGSGAGGGLLALLVILVLTPCKGERVTGGWGRTHFLLASSHLTIDHAPLLRPSTERVTGAGINRGREIKQSINQSSTIHLSRQAIRQASRQAA